MFGCSVDLDLGEFFSDVRKLSCIYIDFKECKEIRDAENHIKRLFNIEEDICLVKTKCLSNDVCLFPSSENIRLLQSVDFAAKVKVLSARSVFQPEAVTVNIDALLLPVVTIKDENCDIKDEHTELHLENEEEIISCYDEGNQNGYGTEIVENVCNKCKDKENKEVTRMICDSSVQTEDVASSGSVSSTELNEYLMDDDQTDTIIIQDNECNFSSNKSKTVNLCSDKNRPISCCVIDLDLEYDSDCEIVDTNTSEAQNISKKKVRIGLKKPLIKFDEPIQNVLHPDVINFRTNLTSDNSVSRDCANKKDRGCKKKKQYQNVANCTSYGELESQEVINFDLTEDSNSEIEYLSAQKTETQNYCKKRKKLSHLESERYTNLEYEFCSNDGNQIEIDETRCEQGTTVVNNSNGTILSKQRKKCKELCLSELESKVKNDSCKSSKNKKVSNEDNLTENNNLVNKTNNDTTETESKTYENYFNENSRKIKTKHMKESSQNLDPLTSLKNKLVEQLNIQLMELQKKETNIPETRDNSSINYSDATLITENGLAYTDSEKNCSTMSSLAVTEDFNEGMLQKKRKRKRKHNKKAKADKLAAAAMMLAPVDFPKPSTVPINHFPRKSTHKFFSEDDFNDDLDPPNSYQHYKSEGDSDLFNEAVEGDNSHIMDEIPDQVGKSELKSAPMVSEHLQSKSIQWSESPSTLVQKSLNTLINEAKTNKQVLVFECKKMLSRNAKQSVPKVKEASTSVETKVCDTLKTNDDVSKKTNSLKSLEHFKHEEVTADIGVPESAEYLNSSSEMVDVSNYPIIESAIEGDIIIFQMLRLGPDYQPTISKQIIAKIISIDSNNPSSKVVSLHVLRGIEEFEKPEGKFSIEETQETESQQCIELNWSELIEPRLFYP